MTNNNYLEDSAVVANAMNAVYENKQTNKKNNISGDFSSDNVSYPTVKAVKDRYEDANSTVKNSHTHGNISTDGKIGNVAGRIATTGENGVLETSATLNNTLIIEANALDKVGTGNNANQHAINVAVNDLLKLALVPRGTPESGMSATYDFTQNGVIVGTINIAKDTFLRTASVETVGASPSLLETNNGLQTGDSYIKLVVNTEASETGTTPLVIPIDNFFDLNQADESSITEANNVFSIKDSGVTTAKIADTAVTNGKLADNAVTTVKIADNSITYQKLNTACVSTLEATMDAKISDFASALAAAINPSS